MNVAQSLYGALGGGLLAIGSATAGTYAISDTADEAATTSHAMIVLESLSQTAGSVIGKRLLDGNSSPISMDQMIREGYLTAYPTNPTTSEPEGRPFVSQVMGPDGFTRDALQMRLVDENGVLCDEIARNVTGQVAPVGEIFPMGAQGCVRTSGGSVAYWRI